MATPMLVRRVYVDRTRTPHRVLDATGCNQYTMPKVVASMPSEGDEEVEIHFFKVGRHLSSAELERQYEERGLKPADPYAVAQVNIDDQAFLSVYPNGTYWREGGQGKLCSIMFYQWGGDDGHVGGPQVSVRYVHKGWRRVMWFAGVRK